MAGIYDFYLPDSGLPVSMEGQVRAFRRKIGTRAKKETWQDFREKEDIFLPDKNLNHLPDGSWLLDFGFVLRKPFASKEEEWITSCKAKDDMQNPVFRDHLLGCPAILPSLWKGHLRFAADMIKVKNDEEIISRLFGDEEPGLRGRLHFFSTFFDTKTDHEVVTPLKRDTRTPARGPVSIEVVPEGAKGRFFLFYFPYPKSENWSKRQIADDLQFSFRVLQAMFLEYGFSAKKTSGWGVIKDELFEGSFLYAKGEVFPGASEVQFCHPVQPAKMEDNGLTRIYSLSRPSQMGTLVEKVVTKMKWEGV